jgi:predicted transcriptional regulator
MSFGKIERMLSTRERSPSMFVEDLIAERHRLIAESLRSGAFSERLRALRLLKDMDQGELAAKSKVDPTTISRLENGHNKNPQRRTVEKLAAALEVPPETLTG